MENPRSERAPRRGSGGSSLVPAVGLRSLVCGVLACLAGCASLSSERHFAPLFTHVSRAGGGSEVEALAGALIRRRPAPERPVDRWSLRPLITRSHEDPERSKTWFLVPLGTHERTRDRLLWQLLPVTRYQREKTETGYDQWTFLSLPGIYWAQFEDGRTVRAWFPFAGVFEDFFSFDRLEFFLFPIYARSQRAGRTNWHFLWPVFGYSHGRGGVGWRFWPLYGRARIRHSYERMFFLWPLFHFHRNRLSLPEELHETKWFVFPIYGKTKAGSFRSYSALWPFFGYSHDPQTKFRAWDGPWPLVRIQRPGESEVAYRTRFWPLYSYFRGDGLQSTYFLWPFFSRRSETSREMRKESSFFIPFWQSWRREHDLEGVSRFQKLWPVYQKESSPLHRSYAFPALNPLWRTPTIDYHYAWIYELFRVEESPGIRRERSWLGLWRRERDADEDRASFVGLWSRRKYRLGEERIRETSLLFGLVRWRSQPSKGLRFLAPALPGPGWPLERVQRSKASTELVAQ